MKTQRNILLAFILNLSFSIFEFVGGIITGSVAIVSDAVHDVGDAASIGISYVLEKKSKRKPDEKYTYGYARYSVMGGFITTLIQLIGSAAMIYNAILRIVTPADINYVGMIVFAIVGVSVNCCAAFFTREGGSINQRAVNLHMLEDALGWIVVLVGASIMRVTDFPLIDPVMSIGVSLFIFVHAIQNLREILDLFLEKAPNNIEMAKIKEHIGKMDGVLDVHHIHIWSMDGQNHFATMHVVTDREACAIKEAIREEMREYGIGHVTIESEKSSEHCHEKQCNLESHTRVAHGHHHHHH